MNFPPHCRAKWYRVVVTSLLLGISTVASSQSEPAPMVTRSGNQISISGQVTPATLQAVQRELSVAKSQSVDTLVIDSTGGDLVSMIQLGTIVNGRKMAVRVNGLCASICAAFLAPAARHLVVPKGSFLVFSPISSPDDYSREVNVSAIKAEAIRWSLERQNAYFRKLNLDPNRIYAVGQAISDMQSALTVAGKTDQPSIVLDAAYLRDCLGVSSVEIPEFNTSESKAFAHVLKRPIAFLINGEIFYEGTEVIPFRPQC